MDTDRITGTLNHETYARMHKESLEDPGVFWSAQAESLLTWYKKWDAAYTTKGTLDSEEWFTGGELNVSYNCIDRHVEAGHGDQVAYYFERNNGETVEISYRTLLTNVSKLANVLKSRGIKKGDRVCIYMPMIPEAIYTMLACARIGAVHSVVFAGFSSAALTTRINDAACVALVTAEVSYRGEKKIPLIEQVETTLPETPSVHTCLVVKASDSKRIPMDIEVDYETAMCAASETCVPEHMASHDPLFILYTSGSTGKPKGVLHSNAGYLLYAAMTHKYVLDYREGDVYWCMADIGWITGHSYLVYGPLANRATSVLYEGVPTYPEPSRPWQIVDKYKVNILYSMPTLLRSLVGYGNAYVEKYSRKSLRILGTVGEPIDPATWRWYHDVVGNGACAVVDTWWQTETGGHVIAPIPGVVTQKPGAAMIPFFGIEPVLVDQEGNILTGEAEGTLLLRGAWPGRMRDLYNDHERFLNIYCKPYPGFFVTGDGARRDADGHIWITGRTDDSLNISGRLIGTAEVESACVYHKDITEAAVVGVPHDIKGLALCVFICLKEGVAYTPSLKAELMETVSDRVGSFVRPDIVYVVPHLPKTRSGKVLRRVLRNIAQGNLDALGDLSTLSTDTDVIGALRSAKPV